jgi:hypothetical protein
MLEIEDHAKMEMSFSFVKTFVNNFRFIIKSEVDLQQNHQKYKSSKEYDNIKLEGVQLQYEGAFFPVRDFHHEGVRSMSNLKTTPTKTKTCIFY